MTEILTTVQLRRLTEHKYSAEGTSVLEPYMQKFWRWLVEQVPLWWAPNAITLVGLLVNVFTTLLLVFYSPDAKQEIPAWALLTCGTGLFIYQALDAIDGKQARRTNSSSPLGELFDHGCDALSIVFVLLGTCCAMNLGDVPGIMFFECMAAYFIFYAAHWQTYVSGTLKFGKIDVTEAQFTVISVYVLTALFGSSFWNFSLPVLNLRIKMLSVYASIAVAAISCQIYFYVIFMQGGSGKNGSTIAGTSVLSPIMPISAVIIMAIMIWQKSSTQLFQLHPCLYILSFGLVITKVTNKLVIAHMTKSEMDILDTSMIGPGMLFLNQYFNTPCSEYLVLWLCFLFCMCDLLRFSVTVCREICDYLNIYCFKITVPPPEVTNNGDHHRRLNETHDTSLAGGDSSNDEAYHRPITRSKAKQTPKLN